MDNNYQKDTHSEVANPIVGVNRITDTYSYGVVYIYSIPDESHKGRVKIGAATYEGSLVDPHNPSYEEQDAINLAAKNVSTNKLRPLTQNIT